MILIISVLNFLISALQAEIDVIQNATNNPDAHHGRKESTEDVPHSGSDRPLQRRFNASLLMSYSINKIKWHLALQRLKTFKYLSSADFAIVLQTCIL